MDFELKYVLRHFKMTKEELFVKKQNRMVADARGVLYALLYEGNYSGVKNLVYKRYGYAISVTAIENGVSIAEKYHSKLLISLRKKIKASRKKLRHPSIIY